MLQRKNLNFKSLEWDFRVKFLNRTYKKKFSSQSGKTTLLSWARCVRQTNQSGSRIFSRLNSISKLVLKDSIVFSLSAEKHRIFLYFIDFLNENKVSALK